MEKAQGWILDVYQKNKKKKTKKMLFPRSPPSLWVSPGKNQGFLAAQLCPVQALGELTWTNESMDESTQR